MSEKCPKCGQVPKYTQGPRCGGPAGTLFACRTFVYASGTVAREGDFCLRRQLSAMTARAEAAEAIVPELLEALQDCEQVAETAMGILANAVEGKEADLVGLCNCLEQWVMVARAAAAAAEGGQ